MHVLQTGQLIISTLVKLSSFCSQKTRAIICLITLCSYIKLSNSHIRKIFSNFYFKTLINQLYNGYVTFYITLKIVFIFDQS